MFEAIDTEAYYNIVFTHGTSVSCRIARTLMDVTGMIRILVTDNGSVINWEHVVIMKKIDPTIKLNQISHGN